MIFRNRPTCPNWLSETSNSKKWGVVRNSEKWGLIYYEKLRNQTKKNKFVWAKYESIGVDKLLLPILKDMTQNHCSFCDHYPIESVGASIEHYKPKSIFPRESYNWDNLFYCCTACQKKNNNYDPLLLKPDRENYDFNHYFITIFKNDRILIAPNPLRNIIEQNSAEITIDLYGFNKFGRPESRFITYSNFNKTINPAIDDFSYRFLFL